MRVLRVAGACAVRVSVCPVVCVSCNRVSCRVLKRVCTSVLRDTRVRVKRVDVSCFMCTVRCRADCALRQCVYRVRVRVRVTCA